MKPFSAQFSSYAIVAVITCTLSIAAPSPASAQAVCDGSTLLEHTFESGAAWSLCAEIEEHAGLLLTDIHYKTPQGPYRRTFSELHLAGVLEHFHNESAETNVLSEAPFGGENFLSAAATECPGRIENISRTAQASTTSVASQNTAICTHHYDNRILAKFKDTDVVQSHSWDLIAAATQGSDAWETVYTLHEEGSISPRLDRSGVVSRFTDDPRFGNTAAPTTSAGAPTNRYAVNMTLLGTWRAVPVFDNGALSQTIEQWDFNLQPDLGNRRPMTIETIETETLRQVDREAFRRWVVKAASGPGYSLQVNNSGFQYRSNQYNWALFNVAFTRYNDCERLSLQAAENCGSSIDDYVNGQSLLNTTPVIWFSQSMPIAPTAEDFPMLRTRSLTFSWLPFDWTDVSPFAPDVTGGGL